MCFIQSIVPVMRIANPSAASGFAGAPRLDVRPALVINIPPGVMGRTMLGGQQFNVLGSLWDPEGLVICLRNDGHSTSFLNWKVSTDYF